MRHPRSMKCRLGHVVAVVLTCACGGGAGEEDAVQPTVTVGTIVVQPQSFAETIDAIGDVQARAGHIAALSAPAPTRVTRVNVTAGQRVRRGTLLVQLEQTVFDASVRSAQAALEAAQANYNRAQRLVDAGISPRKDLDQAAAELAQARENLVTAQRSRDLASLRSPIDGVVTKMDAVLGASVDVNQVLVEVADPSAIDVVLETTPAVAGRLRVGAAVLLRAGEGTTGDTLGLGRVADIGGIVDSVTRSVGVRVRPGSLRRTLRIGETVSGEMTIALQRDAIAVPNEALVPEGDGFKVFVVDSANIAHERDVTVGARAHGLVRILSGLTAGERVVTYGAYGVADSAKVLPSHS
jgi:RND family efflux transporter MFP subunit